MKDHNRARLAIIHQRFAPKARAAAAGGETFEQAFARVCDRVLVPVLEDVAAELRALGHAPEVVVGPVDHDGGRCDPAVALRLGIRNATGRSNVIALGVIRWRLSGKSNDDPEVLAFHVKDAVAFDLFRFKHPDELRPDVVEQLVVDSVEALFAQNAR